MYSVILKDDIFSHSFVSTAEMHPLTLQEICRSTIRVLLRLNVETENPSILDKKRAARPKKSRGKRNLKRIVIPLLQGGEISDDLLHEPQPPSLEEDSEEHSENDDELATGPGFTTHLTSSNSKLVFDFRLNAVRGKCKEQHAPETVEEVPSEEESRRHSGTSDENVDMELDPPKDKGHQVNGDSGIDNISDDSFGQSDAASSFEDRPRNPYLKSSYLKKRSVEEDDNDDEGHSSSYVKRSAEEDNTDEGHEPRSSLYLKRSAEEDNDEEEEEEGLKPRTNGDRFRNSAVIFKRVAFSDADSDDFDEMDSDSGTDYLPNLNPTKEEKSDMFAYTDLMRLKIDKLPLPQALKCFLNFARPV